MAESAIEWTHSTWNPVTGCTKVSPGCKHCYAERMSKRLRAMGVDKYRNEFGITLHPGELDRPFSWKGPRTVFVNSMSDLFHEEVPESFIHRIFEVMRKTDWHQYQILTKRASRLATLASRIDWPANVWMGVSVENSGYVDRIDMLRTTDATIKFLSLEPLLGPLSNLNLEDIDWVIVGGESGPGARPIKKAWVVDIRDQCIDAGVPFFFKQWGGVNKKRNGRVLDDREWNQMPRTVELAASA